MHFVLWAYVLRRLLNPLLTLFEDQGYTAAPIRSVSTYQHG